MVTEPLDFLPLWLFCLLAVAVILLSYDAGYRVGLFRARRTDEEKESPVGAMAGATLGLLAFMLAFTFGMAASRLDSSRQVLLDEANSIGTTYLRAGLLAEPYCSEIRGLLRQYVDALVEAAETDNAEPAIRETGRIHEELWSRAEKLGKEDPQSIVVGLFIQSLNETIDLQAKRITVVLRRRIPLTLWFVLTAIAILSLTAMGYHAGLTKTRRPLAVLPVALSFALVMLLIVDLDRPQRGMVRVNQQVMLDLQASMATDVPAAKQ